MECEPFETQKLYLHNGHHLNLKDHRNETVLFIVCKR